MKYLKISSLLVLSLLLFVPAALADVTCELRTNTQRIRMESENEPLDALTIRCTWLQDDITDDSTFDLEVQFEGDLSNDDDTPATLWLRDLAATDDDNPRTAVPAADGTPAVTGTDEMGNRDPAPAVEVGRDSVYWENIKFPDTWAIDAGTADTRGSGIFTIADLFVDVTSVDDERLEAMIEMDGNDLGSPNDTAAVLTADSEAVSVARVDQALNLEIAEGSEANDKINACVPGTFDIKVTLEEGFRSAWMDDNDIMLTASSGKITAKDTGIFDVTGEGDDDELIIDVTSGPSTDTADLLITFAPASGGVGDDLTLSAMLLPMRRSDESFVVSSTLVVGSYVACTGNTLVFPFISNMGGFDTGVVLVNDSKVDGECSLFWDGVMLTNDDDEVVVDDRDMMDVDSKDQTAFILSMQNAGFQGLLSAECSFKPAYGYAYITDTAGTGAQGYLAEVMEE